MPRHLSSKVSISDTCVLPFLCRLLKDYLKQCRNELNYIEAGRANEKHKELAEHEMKRQVKYMEDKQRQELVHIEAMQRMQFEEFTRAWDQYMASYEQTAFQSIEKLKAEQHMELLNLHQLF